MLIAYGAEVDARDRRQVTALMLASVAGHLDILQAGLLAALYDPKSNSNLLLVFQIQARHLCIPNSVFCL